MALALSVQHNTTRAVIALGAKRSSDIPKPFQVPPPNAHRPRQFTRHDYRKALMPPRR